MVAIAAVVPEEHFIVLSALAPGRAHKRLALAVIIALVLVLLLTEGASSTSKVARFDAFVPVYALAIFVNDSITALLLYAQFSISRSRAQLVLASGYLVTSLIVVPWTLTFTGVFAPLGLLGTEQQVGFPLFVIAYAGWLWRQMVTGRTGTIRLTRSKRR
jgi:hypothetical protein